jgi:hypothetical protein
MPKTMSKDELVFRVKAYGCKMLDRMDLEAMTREQVVRHLKKSCCKVYERMVKEFGEDFVGGTINERTNP